MNILITGFDNFAGDTINPSKLVLEKLPKKILNNNIITLELPTVFNTSAEILEKSINEHKPTIIISLGLAAGRASISIERVAINIDDARIEDNCGNKPIDKKIKEDGDTAYFSNLPIKSIFNDLRKKNIPVEISNTAGTYVCNHIMYNSLYLINKQFPNSKAGFIHIPCIPEQTVNKPSMPSMDITLITSAVISAIESSIINHGKSDIILSGGKEH